MALDDRAHRRKAAKPILASFTSRAGRPSAEGTPDLTTQSSVDLAWMRPLETPAGTVSRVGLPANQRASVS